MSRDDRNWNPKYLQREKDRLSSSPQKFLGSWLTKSRYESKKGIKAPIAEDVTKEFLKKVWDRVDGKCYHSKKKMSYIKGEGVVV